MALPIETCINIVFNNGDVRPITNFQAWIIKEFNVVAPDGTTIERRLIIEGKIGDKMLPPINVNSTELSGTDWVLRHWGFMLGLEVYPVHNAAKHLQSAIARASTKLESTTYLQGMGFNTVRGELMYTAGAGSISSTGNCPGLLSKLAHPLHLFAGGMPTKNRVRLKNAFLALQNLRDVSSVHPFIGTLLIASMFRPILSIFDRTDYSIWLVGLSGAFKSSIAALVMNFYGKEFTVNSMPANWIDTLASLEEKMGLVRHAPLCIDDYLEEGPHSSDYVTKAHSLIRMTGDGTIKGKMQSSKELKSGDLLTALPLITAELLPRQLESSALNRCILCPVLEGEILPETLTRLQGLAHRGAYLQIASNFIQYVIQHRDFLSKEFHGLLENEHEIFRNELGSNSHARQPRNFASLMLGIHGMLYFAETHDLLTPAECNSIELRCREDLVSLAKRQNQLHETTSLGELFIRRLQSALLRGKCYVRIYSTGAMPDPDIASSLGWHEGKPNGLHIGWYVPTSRMLYLRDDDAGNVHRLLLDLDKRLRQDKKGIGETSNRLGRFLIENQIHGGSESARDNNKLRRTPCGEHGGKQSVIAIQFPLD
jgi:hypothetical protein